jgi:hypothetical protein
MSKLHHTKYKQNYKQYILERIDIEGTNQDKARYLLDRILREKSYEIKRMIYNPSHSSKTNPAQIIADWLQGLAIDIPYYNHDIQCLAVDMGSIDENSTVAQMRRILDGYWLFMANIVLWIIKSEGLSINELYGCCPRSIVQL